jgi:hypothetical protein
MRNRSLNFLLILLLSLTYSCQQNKTVETESEEIPEIENQQPKSEAWQKFSASDDQGMMQLNANGEEIVVTIGEETLYFPQVEARIEGGDWRFSSSLIEGDMRHYMDLAITPGPCALENGRMAKLDLDGQVFRLCVIEQE